MPGVKWNINRNQFPDLYCKSMDYLGHACQNPMYKKKYSHRDLIKAVSLDEEIETNFKYLSMTVEECMSY